MPKLTRTKRRSKRSQRSIPKSKRSKTRRKIRQQRGGQQEWETPFSKYSDASNHYYWWAGVESRNGYVPMTKWTWDRIRFLGRFAPIHARKWFDAEVRKGRGRATASVTAEAEAAAKDAEAAAKDAEAAAAKAAVMIETNAGSDET